MRSSLVLVVVVPRVRVAFLRVLCLLPVDPLDILLLVVVDLALKISRLLFLCQVIVHWNVFAIAVDLLVWCRGGMGWRGDIRQLLLLVTSRVHRAHAVDLHAVCLLFFVDSSVSWSCLVRALEIGSQVFLLLHLFDSGTKRYWELDMFLRLYVARLQYFFGATNGVSGFWGFHPGWCGSSYCRMKILGGQYNLRITPDS